MTTLTTPWTDPPAPVVVDGPSKGAGAEVGGAVGAGEGGVGVSAGGGAGVAGEGAAAGRGAVSTHSSAPLRNRVSVGGNVHNASGSS